MTTPQLTELQRSITQGPWALMHLPFFDSDLGIDLKGNNGNTLIANFPTLAKIDGLAYTPSDEDAANLAAIALVPELIAEVIRLREVLRACVTQLDAETLGGEALDSARAALANDK